MALTLGREQGPFEGPATLKPPALPGDTYQSVVQRWLRMRKALRNPQGVFVGCVHGDGTARSHQGPQEKFWIVLLSKTNA